MGKRGGARPNSGPKKGSHHKKTLEIEAARTALFKRVAKELHAILDAQLDLAKGHLVQEITKEGEKRIYLKSPDRGAAEMLLNQAIGKATEFIDLTSGGKLLQILVKRYENGNSDNPAT